MPRSRSTDSAVAAAPSDGAAAPAPADDSGWRRCVYGFIHAIDRISAVVAVLAAVLLVLGVLFVCHMIFVRYVLEESTIWQTELTVYSITAAMLLGSPYVLQTGGHVSVTVLYDLTSGITRRLMRLAAALSGLAFCVALAYGAWHYVWEAYAGGWRSSSVWGPLIWPAVTPVAVGATLLCLQYVAEILRGEL